MYHDILLRGLLTQPISPMQHTLLLVHDRYVSRRMIANIVDNAIPIVNVRAQMVQERFGGERWTAEEGWELELSNHF